MNKEEFNVGEIILIIFLKYLFPTSEFHNTKILLYIICEKKSAESTLQKYYQQVPFIAFIIDDGDKSKIIATAKKAQQTQK